VTLTKPQRLFAGDTIATVSVSHGWAGDENILWKYELGKKRLEEVFGLKVIDAPNSMRGSKYLSENPQARAEDVMWAFADKYVKAIIANIGGNDSIRVIPFVDPSVIKNNPKIFIGSSDALNLHLLCYKNGLSTFYGHNLLPTIAEAQGLHPYSEKWFRKVLFDASPIGDIEPSDDWTYEAQNYTNSNYKRRYYPNPGYKLIQGMGIVRGRLIDGHTFIADDSDCSLALDADDFNGAILFVEDIPEFFSPEQAADFFRRLGQLGWLQRLNGIVIGRINENIGFDKHSAAIRKVIAGEFEMDGLPVLYGLNFGHTSPSCILPYGAMAEINCEALSFAILDSGVE